MQRMSSLYCELSQWTVSACSAVSLGAIQSSVPAPVALP